MVFMPQLAIPVLPAITALKVLTPSNPPVLQDSFAKKVLTNKIVLLGSIVLKVQVHRQHALQAPTTRIHKARVTSIAHNALQEPTTPMNIPILQVLAKNARQEHSTLIKGPILMLLVKTALLVNIARRGRQMKTRLVLLVNIALKAPTKWHVLLASTALKVRPTTVWPALKNTFAKKVLTDKIVLKASTVPRVRPAGLTALLDIIAL